MQIIDKFANWNGEIFFSRMPGEKMVPHRLLHSSKQPTKGRPHHTYKLFERSYGGEEEHYIREMAPKEK